MTSKNKGGANDGALPKLTGKQQAFVEAYFACDFNGTKAAEKAGYKGNNPTLRAIASENLTKPNIKKAIAQRFADKQMGADEVIMLLTEHARASMADFVTFVDGVRQPALNLEAAYKAGKFRAVKKIKVKQTPLGNLVLDFELYDALRALELLGKANAIFADVGLNGDEVEDWREYAKRRGVPESEAIAEAQSIVNAGRGEHADASGGGERSATPSADATGATA